MESPTVLKIVLESFHEKCLNVLLPFWVYWKLMKIQMVQGREPLLTRLCFGHGFRVGWGSGKGLGFSARQTCSPVLGVPWKGCQGKVRAHKSFQSWALFLGSHSWQHPCWTWGLARVRVRLRLRHRCRTKSRAPLFVGLQRGCQRNEWAAKAFSPCHFFLGAIAGKALLWTWP